MLSLDSALTNNASVHLSCYNCTYNALTSVFLKFEDLGRQAFLRRDQNGCLDHKGLIWGAPYRRGSMVIAYRTYKLSKNNIPGFEDWKDLWKLELTRKIAMVGSSREVVGAVLKSLGALYITQDFDKDVKGGRAIVKQ